MNIEPTSEPTTRLVKAFINGYPDGEHFYTFTEFGTVEELFIDAEFAGYIKVTHSNRTEQILLPFSQVTFMLLDPNV